MSREAAPISTSSWLGSARSCTPSASNCLAFSARPSAAWRRSPRRTGLKLTTASAHLQVIRYACLVETRRDGTRVFYRAAGEEVWRFVGALNDLARARLAEVDQNLRSLETDAVGAERVSRDELLASWWHLWWQTAVSFGPCGQGVCLANWKLPGPKELVAQLLS